MFYKDRLTIEVTFFQHECMAEIIELDGCRVGGKDEYECLYNIGEALMAYVKSLKKHKEKVFD